SRRMGELGFSVKIHNEFFSKESCDSATTKKVCYFLCVSASSALIFIFVFEEPLLNPLQAGNQFLGEVLFRLRPQYATADAGVLLDLAGELNQLLHVGAHSLLRNRGQPDIFVKERRVEPEVNLH